MKKKKGITYEEWVKLTAQESTKDKYQIHYTLEKSPTEWNDSPWYVWYTEQYEQKTAEEEFEKWAIKKGIEWTGYKIMKNGEWTSPTTSQDFKKKGLP